MTSDLAKQLKDAGFPQEGKGMFCGNVGLIKPEDFTPNGVVVMTQEDFLYLPTLEELIEVMGNNFRNVNQDMAPVWQANAYLNSTGDNFAHGSTPTEAVARLWLALNKK